MCFVCECFFCLLYAYMCAYVCVTMCAYISVNVGVSVEDEYAHVWEACLLVYMCGEYANNQPLVVVMFSACLHALGRSCCGSTKKELRSSFLMPMTSMWSRFLLERGAT